MFPTLLEWARARNQPITVFDLETTTTIPTASWMGITELGMVTIRPDGKLDEVDSLVDPGRSIPPKVRALTGISNADVSGQPSWERWAKRLHDYARDHVMIGYNSSSFDCPTIVHQNVRYGVSGTRFHYSLDAMKLPGVQGKLEDAAARFGIASGTYHRAMRDVSVTARMVEHLASIHGVDVLDAALASY